MVEIQIIRNKAGEWFYKRDDVNHKVEIDIGPSDLPPWDDYNTRCGRFATIKAWEQVRETSLRLTRPEGNILPGIIAILTQDGITARDETGKETGYKVQREMKGGTHVISDSRLLLMASLWTHINKFRLVGIEVVSQEGGIILQDEIVLTEEQPSDSTDVS